MCACSSGVYSVRLYTVYLRVLVLTEHVIKAVIRGVLCGGISMRNGVMLALVDFEGRGE